MKTIYQLDRVDLAKIVAGILGLPVTSDSVESFFELLCCSMDLGKDETQTFAFYPIMGRESRIELAARLLLNLRAFYGYTLVRLNTGDQRAMFVGRNELDIISETEVEHFVIKFDNDIKNIILRKRAPALMEIFK